MKKVLIVILIVLFAFALVRIITSTYENLTRYDRTQRTVIIPK